MNIVDNYWKVQQIDDWSNEVAEKVNLHSAKTGIFIASWGLGRYKHFAIGDI